jgi:hypothetical protein
MKSKQARFIKLILISKEFCFLISAVVHKDQRGSVYKINGDKYRSSYSLNL